MKINVLHINNVLHILTKISSLLTQHLEDYLLDRECKKYSTGYRNDNFSSPILRYKVIFMARSFINSADFATANPKMIA